MEECPACARELPETRKLRENFLRAPATVWQSDAALRLKEDFATYKETRQ